MKRNTERPEKVDWLEYALVAGLVALGVIAAMRGLSAHAQSTPAPAAQTWFKVSAESSTLSATLPAGTAYRFGTPSCPAGTVVNGVALPATAPSWTQGTVAAQTTISPVSMAGSTAAFGFSDPCYGTVKELDVLITAAPQIVTTDDTARTPSHWNLLVPVLPPALGSGTHQVILTNFHDDGGSSSALLLWAANQPANGASNSWGGTSFTLEIDGFPMACSYDQNNTPGVFSLKCTAGFAQAGQ